MQDFLGNELNVGDKVIIVFGTHLRHSVIEDIIYPETGQYMHRIKIVDLKSLIHPNKVIKPNEHIPSDCCQK